ncbi:Probable multidrug-efflux transporter Rv1634/MT1670 [Providencia stuartii]|nr:Probable multidrug-efflux transporter Rv1634/MT1670 [Providencia stuartii]
MVIIRFFPSGTFRFSAQLAPIYLTMALFGSKCTNRGFCSLFFTDIAWCGSLVIRLFSGPSRCGLVQVPAIASSSLKPTVAVRIIRFAPLFTLVGLTTLALFITKIIAIEAFQVWIICIGLFITGASIGAAWPHLLTRVLQVSAGSESQKASSAITTLQLFSTAFGASLAGMIANLAGLSSPGGIEGAQSASIWLFYTLFLSTLLCANYR